MQGIAQGAVSLTASPASFTFTIHACEAAARHAKRLIEAGDGTAS
jgi:hypothetical protein